MCLHDKFVVDGALGVLGSIDVVDNLRHSHVLSLGLARLRLVVVALFMELRVEGAETFEIKGNGTNAVGRRTTWVGGDKCWDLEQEEVHL